MRRFVVLPAQLREMTGGEGRLALELSSRGGGLPTVGDVLETLRRDHPAVHARMVTERHELRPHVNVFVGRDDIRWLGGLDAAVPEGSEVVVLPSVSGG